MSCPKVYGLRIVFWSEKLAILLNKRMPNAIYGIELVIASIIMENMPKNRVIKVEQNTILLVTIILFSK